MAVELTGDVLLNELPEITRPNLNVNYTISAEGNENEIITNISTTLIGSQSNINIVNGATSTITGEIEDPFLDVFHFVDEGFANNPGYSTHQDEQEVIGVENMPENKVLYELIQDLEPTAVTEFTVVVTYNTVGESMEIDETGVQTTFNVTLTVNNSWDGIYDFMQNYY